MTKLFKSIVLLSILMSVVPTAAKASCWVKNQTSTWYYFRTLCCNKFYINPALAEDCYNIPGSCWGAFQDNSEPENLAITTPEGVPSLSFLKEINNFTIEIKPDGSGVISVGGVKAVTLTSEGVTAFFQQSPAVFYESTEKKTFIEHEAISMEESKERIISVTPELTSPDNVVRLGQLDDNQVSMIKRMSEAGKKAPVEKYAFKISPNPSTSETNLSFTLSKNTQATLYIVDIFGSVKKQNNYALQSGNNNLTVDLQQYTPGTYMVLLDFGYAAVGGSFIRQ